MPLYHCNISTIGKGAGRSAVQFGAYIDGDKGHNERTGENYNHTSKEEVAYANMIFTDNVPIELQNRHDFWNAVEKNESADNARFSRTWELTFDNAASLDQMKEQVEKFARSLIEDGYCAVQYGIHNKEGNKHCHLMAPCRQMVNGEWEKFKEIKGYLCINRKGEQQIFRSAKDIPDEYERIPILDDEGKQKEDSHGRKQWVRKYIKDDPLNSKEMLIKHRARWADIMNEYIDNPEEYVSHLSYKARSIDKIPTIHLGNKAFQLEKKGIKTKLGNYNRAVRFYNNHRDLEKRIARKEKLIKKLKDMLKEFIREASRPVRSTVEKIDIITKNKTKEAYKIAVGKAIEAQKGLAKKEKVKHR